MLKIIVRVVNTNLQICSVAILFAALPFAVLAAENSRSKNSKISNKTILKTSPTQLSPSPVPSLVPTANSVQKLTQKSEQPFIKNKKKIISNLKMEARSTKIESTDRLTQTSGELFSSSNLVLKADFKRALNTRSGLGLELQVQYNPFESMMSNRPVTTDNETVMGGGALAYYKPSRSSQIQSGIYYLPRPFVRALDSTALIIEQIYLPKVQVGIIKEWQLSPKYTLGAMGSAAYLFKKSTATINIQDGLETNAQIYVARRFTSWGLKIGPEIYRLKQDTSISEQTIHEIGFSIGVTYYGK